MALAVERTVESAPAKINLWLNVVGRRADGYHLLHSLVAFADLADTVEVRRSDSGLSLTLDGPGAPLLAGDADNLVLKAARLLAAEAGVAANAALHLTKHIPVAAGLGGGSADAAAALRALSRLWNVSLPDKRLQAIAARIGADVPMCLASQPALATGVGEVLTAVPALPDCALLMVNPGVALPTRDVFTARRGAFTPEIPAGSWSDLTSFTTVLAAHGNDLTAAAISLQPVVGEVLQALKKSAGVRHAAMSGSGATCFALYATEDEARRAASALPVAWWRHVGRLAAPDLLRG